MTQKEQAVFTVADYLLDANNQVTTLEVKNKLRQDFPNEFWTQQYVSDVMRSFADEDKLDFDDNGTYRVYKMPVVSNAVVSNIAQQISTVSQAIDDFSLAQDAAHIPANTVSQALVNTAQPAKINNPLRTASGRKSKFNPVNPKRISKTDALSKIRNSGGQFMTVQYLKKGGEVRVLNGKYITDQQPSELGYFKMTELSKAKATPNDSIRNVNIQTLQVFKLKGEYFKLD